MSNRKAERDGANVNIPPNVQPDNFDRIVLNNTAKCYALVKKLLTLARTGC